jgi:hypothetical protein
MGRNGERNDRLMTWLERRAPSRLDSFYRMALDYFFWLGANSAPRDIDRAGLRFELS